MSVIERFRRLIIRRLDAVDRKDARDFAVAYLTSNGASELPIIGDNEIHIGLNIQMRPGQLAGIAVAPWVAGSYISHCVISGPSTYIDDESGAEVH